MRKTLALLTSCWRRTSKQIADDYQQALRDVRGLCRAEWYSGTDVLCRDCLLRRLPFAVLPAHLIQAQRDYFGAHTYKRTDKKVYSHRMVE